MGNTRVFVCENSIDGIFTAVYDAWSSGYGHNNVRIEEQCEKTVIPTWHCSPII